MVKIASALGGVAATAEPRPRSNVKWIKEDFLRPSRDDCIDGRAPGRERLTLEAVNEIRVDDGKAGVEQPFQGANRFLRRARSSERRKVGVVRRLDSETDAMHAESLQDAESIGRCGGRRCFHRSRHAPNG